MSEGLDPNIPHDPIEELPFQVGDIIISDGNSSAVIKAAANVNVSVISSMNYNGTVDILTFNRKGQVDFVKNFPISPDIQVEESVNLEMLLFGTADEEAEGNFEDEYNKAAEQIPTIAPPPPEVKE